MEKNTDMAIPKTKKIKLTSRVPFTGEIAWFVGGRTWFGLENKGTWIFDQPTMCIVFAASEPVKLWNNKESINEALFLIMTPYWIRWARGRDIESV